jgi:short-subunit dehydrogenase
MARECARHGHDVVVVARRGEELEALKGELEGSFGVSVHCLVFDLSLPDAPGALVAKLRESKLTIDVLVNNAGFGDYGDFVKAQWDKLQRMISLNITALTQLCHLLLPAMVERGSGRILNVASTAAFQPGPGMAVYYATKAYVLHLSEALRHELRQSGVSVTALCPGPTQSGFADAAAAHNHFFFKSKGLPTSAQVAHFGYGAMMRGKAVAVHGVLNRLMSFSVRLTPRGVVVWMVGAMQRS